MKAHFKLWVKVFEVASIILVIISAATSSSYAAGPWYVAPSGNDSNDCLSAATPCETINGAIAKASSGDTIYVTTGTYTGTGYEVVLIDKSVTLSGGWDSTFSAQSGSSNIDGEGARGLMTVKIGMTAIVESFVFQNGSFGIVTIGTVTLNSITVRDNMDNGIFNGSRLTINNSIISGNVANNGGGINNRSILTINNSIISGNTANPGSGGGIENGYELTLNNSTVSGNVAASHGGGISNHGTLTINESTIGDNTAGFDGGGLSTHGSSTVTLINSTVSGNTASNRGGGIYTSSYSDNSVILNSITVCDNTAVQNGGGIYKDNYIWNSVLLQNTILTRNTSGGAPDCSVVHPFYPIDSLGYNIIGNTSGCTFTPGTGDLTNLDPNLGPLQDNGGPTETHAIFGIPPVNSGNPAGCTDYQGNPLAFDQRGVPRQGRCDIGAFEAFVTYMPIIFR